MKISSIRAKFVEFIPKELEEGVLYISEKYKTASHKCACGCGERVVTPLSPVDWQLRKEGDVVTLMPSIGNWNYACRSHYYIRKNKIQWAKSFSQKQVDWVQRKDRIDKEMYIERLNREAARDIEPAGEQRDAPHFSPNQSAGARIASWLRRFLAS